MIGILLLSSRASMTLRIAYKLDHTTMDGGFTLKPD